MLFIRLFVMSFSILCGHVSAQSEKQILEDMAKPLSEDVTFYRWQTEVSGNNMISHGKFSDTLHKYFMGMPANRMTMLAGQGVYVAENPYSSSNFVGKRIKALLSKLN